MEESKTSGLRLLVIAPIHYEVRIYEENMMNTALGFFYWEMSKNPSCVAWGLKVER